MPIEQALMIEQALTPDDLSTMQILAVPDLWPPIDCGPAVDLCSQQGGFALADGSGGVDEPVGTRPGEATPGVRRPDDSGPDDGRPEAGGPEAGGPEAGGPEAGGPAWPRQFAVLLAEALTGDRPTRQILPWLSPRGCAHLHRLLPLFRDGQRARVHRVLTAQPTPDVIEMTLIVAIGPRIRALAVRLTLARPERRPGWRQQRGARAAALPSAAPAGWLCTDIEAA